MWVDFDSTVYTRDGYRAHVAAIPIEKMGWVKELWLHNCGSPNIAQWSQVSDLQHIINLQHYYETTMGWHAGPHGFNSYSGICGFSDLTRPGVHCSCANSHSLGFETAGDFRTGADDPTAGRGKAALDNSAFVLAVWCLKLHLDPRRALHFHRECTRDHHACPGNLVTMDMVTSMVVAHMGLLDGQPVPASVPHPVMGGSFLLPAPAPLGYMPAHAVAWAQDALDRLGEAPRLDVDNIEGHLTRAAIEAFQKRSDLIMDGLIGPHTIGALRYAMAQLPSSAKRAAEPMQQATGPGFPQT